MRKLTTFSLAGATAALALSPVQAAQLPPVAQPAAQIAPVAGVGSMLGVDEAQQYRRHRYHRYHRRHRGGGVDADDVIAGALILGGIFAVASAATSSDRDDRDYVRNDDFDRAVDRCIARVERQSRVGSVDNVGRTGSGYAVTGTTYDGGGFTCRVDRSGRVVDVRYGQGYRDDVGYRDGRGYQGGQGYQDDLGYQTDQTYGDPQYSDETYARVRGSTSQGNTYSTQSDGYPSQGSTAQSAYPGGPLPGEDYDDYGDGSDDGYGEPY